MKIVLINPNHDMETIEVDQLTDFDTFKMIVASYVNINPIDLLVAKDGKQINGDGKSTLANLGLKDGDVIYSSKRPRSPIQGTSRPLSSNALDFSNINPGSLFGRPATTGVKRSAPVDASEQMRQQLLSMTPDLLSQYKSHNPRLIENLHNKEQFAIAFNDQRKQYLDRQNELQQLYSADIMNPETQRKIEEIIKRNNIDSQMEHAMEHNPESFAQTTMLYIKCNVNKNEVKAFVDSGAQMTFVSLAFAKRCHVEHLIDTRWKGIARGVGTQHIVGRVHCIQLEINGKFLQMSVSVLEDQEMDMLIGLDMLKRFQCSINLKRNVLEIGSYNIETPFLPENELPSHARLNGKN